MGNSAFFRGKQQIPRQTANSAARRENPRARGITAAGPSDARESLIPFEALF